MRKLPIILAALLAAALVLSASTAVAKPKQAGGRLTIESYPGGVFGSLSGASEQCSKGRKIVVYERGGDRRDPATDPRVADTKAVPDEGGYGWQLQTSRTGDLYAVATARGGCGEIQSGSVPATLFANDESEYPPCGPYVSEGASEICQFTFFKADLKRESFFSPCRFGPSEGGCPGRASGLPPWSGTVQISWHQSGPVRAFEVSAGGSTGRLDGWTPNSSSEKFTVTSGFATNEYGGNRFYTPNLPGQAAGEVGGPLYLRWTNGVETGSTAEIWGYLYLKRG